MEVFRKLLFSLSCAIVLLASGADAAVVPLEDAKVIPRLDKFPGATGSVSRVGTDWRIHYDFTGGGHGIGMSVVPKTPIWASKIVFDAFHGEGHALCVLIEDSTGQTLRKVAEPSPGGWRSFVCDIGTGWGAIRWGGANDGIVHFPIRSLSILADRLRKGIGNPEEVGDVLVRNLAYVEMSEEERAECMRGDTPGIRYTVTDFSPGDRFSAGPRAFYRGDFAGNFGQALSNGLITVDFSKENFATLYNNIPIWGQPEEFLLTVEAPAEAAGTEFLLGVRAGRPNAFKSFGKLRPPVPGRSRIYQTLSIPGPCNAEGWDMPKEGEAKGMSKSKRLVQVVVKRGDAPAERVSLRLVRLEAVVPSCRFGEDGHPPLLPVPPSGAMPPRELKVQYLNLSSLPMRNAEIRVSVSDWNGRDLGTACSPVPETGPGDRAHVTVKLPDAPDGLNFISYECELFSGGCRVAMVPGWDTSWTRPLPDAGSSEKRPELPWGMGVYIYRSEDLFAYASGYAISTNEAALARMEQRAALAQAAGIKWERAEIQASLIACAKGKYDFSYYDRFLEIADRHGITCCLNFSHYWPVGYKPYTQEGYDAYAETVRRTVERYKGRATSCEIWNEVNIGFWTGPKEDYVKLANAAYRAVKDVDPEMRVITCSTAGVDLKFIDMCITNGMAYDDISIHTYRADTDERALLADLAAVTNRSHGNPTWITEMGWPTGCGTDTVSEREQAWKYARAYMTAVGSGMTSAIFGYDFVDDGFNVLERENNFGIVRRDLTPKPAYRALAKVCRTFDGGEPRLEQVKFSDGGAWVFRMGEKAAVWATRTMRLNAATARPATATNLMDEEMGRGRTEHVVETGPALPVFFDADIISVSLPQDGEGQPTPKAIEF